MAEEADRDEPLPVRLPTSTRSASGPLISTGENEGSEADSRRVVTLPKTDSRLKLKLLQEEMGVTDTTSGKTGDSILGEENADGSDAVLASDEAVDDDKRNGDGKKTKKKKASRSRSKSRSRSPRKGSRSPRKGSKSRSLSKSPSKRKKQGGGKGEGQGNGAEGLCKGNEDSREDEEDAQEKENVDDGADDDDAGDAGDVEQDGEAKKARKKRRSPSKKKKNANSKSPTRKSRSKSPAKKRKSKSPRKARNISADGSADYNEEGENRENGEENGNDNTEEVPVGEDNANIEAEGENDIEEVGENAADSRGRKRHKTSKRKEKTGAQSPSKVSKSPNKHSPNKRSHSPRKHTMSPKQGSLSPRKYGSSPHKPPRSPKKKTLSPKLRMGPPKPRKPDTPPEPEEYATNVIEYSEDGAVKILGDVRGENSFEIPGDHASAQRDGKGGDEESTLVREGTLEKIEMITQRAQKTKLKKKRRKKKKKAIVGDGVNVESDNEGNEEDAEGGLQSDDEKRNPAEDSPEDTTGGGQEGENASEKGSDGFEKALTEPDGERQADATVSENSKTNDDKGSSKVPITDQPSKRTGRTRQSSREKGLSRRSSTYYTRSYMKPKEGSALQLGSIDPSTGKRKKVVYIVCNHRVPHRIYTTEDRDRGVPIKCELCLPYLKKESSLSGDTEGKVEADASVSELQEPSGAADTDGDRDGDSVKLPPLDIAGAQSLAEENGDEVQKGSRSERASTAHPGGGSLMSTRSESGLRMHFLENGGATPFPARMYFEPRKKLDDYPWLASVAKMPKPPEPPPRTARKPAEIDILRARRFNSLRPKASHNDPVFSRSTRTDRIRKNQKESLLRMQRLKMEALSQVKQLSATQDQEHNKHAPDWKDDLKEYTKWKDQLAEQIETMLKKDFPPELDWMVHKKHADAEQTKKLPGEDKTMEDESGAPYEWKYDIRTKMIDEWQFSRNMTFED